MTFFKVGKEDVEVYLKGHAERCTHFLEDKTTQIHLQLVASVVAGPMEAPGVGSCPVIWEWFDLVAP